MRRIIRLAFVLVFAGLLALPQRPAQAYSEWGYLWSLSFDFEQDFTGVLKIEVGPWVNGDLAKTVESSVEKVTCTRVGNVGLNGGDAVFNGGHLQCTLDLAGILYRNHGLVLNPIDRYGSIFVETTLQASKPNLAPIISHPDADYRIDFTNSVGVTLFQELENNAGVQSGHFPSVTGVGKVKYGFKYGCIWMGPCNGSFSADGQQDVTPFGGDYVEFRTSPVTFFIGGDGVNKFGGRMSDLLIDPGNSVH